MLQEKAERGTLSGSPDRSRSGQLRKQVERLKTLRGAQDARSSTSGADSDSDVQSFLSVR